MYSWSALYLCLHFGSNTVPAGIPLWLPSGSCCLRRPLSEIATSPLVLLCHAARMMAKELPAILLGPSLFALILSLPRVPFLPEQFVVWSAYGIALAFLRALERRWGVVCHRQDCRCVTTLVVGSIVGLHLDTLNALACMLMLGVLPPHCLWYAPKESTSACKRPAAVSPEEHWQTNFRDLRRWLSTHRRQYPQRRNSAGNTEWRLALWCAKQRRFCAAATLESTRRAALESLPGWQWRPQADQWEADFESLEAS